MMKTAFKISSLIGLEFEKTNWFGEVITWNLS